MIDAISGSGSMTTILNQLSMSQQQLNAFQKADKDGNGSLDSSELQTFMGLLSQMSGTPANADKLLTAIDANGNGSVDESEFKAGQKIVQETLNFPVIPPPQQGANPFDQTDANGSGTLDATEIQSFLDAINKMTGKTVGVDEFITALDGNKDGVIDRREFETGRETAEKLLGLPENKNPSSTPPTAKTSAQISEQASTIMANYLSTLGSENQKTLLSMLA